jgi:tetratricopeptide (TPR) repeat protein
MSQERTRIPKLDESIQLRIDELCAEGDGLAAAEKYDEAVIVYTQAFSHLPMPTERWYAANRILTSISDALFRKGDYAGAAEHLQKVMLTPGATENSFIRLRRGQTAFERGSFGKAEQELAAVYMVEGQDAFKDQDPKYLEFIESKILPPEA